MNTWYSYGQHISMWLKLMRLNSVDVGCDIVTVGVWWWYDGKVSCMIYSIRPKTHWVYHEREREITLLQAVSHWSPHGTQGTWCSLCLHVTKCKCQPLSTLESCNTLVTKRRDHVWVVVDMAAVGTLSHGHQWWQAAIIVTSTNTHMMWHQCTSWKAPSLLFI